MTEVFQHLRKKFGPDAKIFGIGISFGANILIRHAGLNPNTCELSGIASISNPHDLVFLASSIKRTHFGVYDLFLGFGF